MGMAIPSVQANNPFVPKAETWNYSIQYKYGLVVMKAGSAQYRLNAIHSNGRPAVKLALDFKTNAFFDKIFFIRDTLTTVATFPDYTPLYHTRSVNEGNTHFFEEIWTRKFGIDYTESQIKRIQNGEVRIDTVLCVSNLGYDILSVFLYMRQNDYATMNPGDNRYITTFLGTKKTNLIIRYAGPTVFEGRNKQKRNAFFFAVDISDEVFSHAKNAMEIWVSDDEYHIPLKMKAKLKIGAAEAELM
ncbi:hypothetical protein FACS1894182_05140 [Bacteroidia bacterium]|nr:hypothetical protein FACS1894182_05140 [Bacteroidia bacterium]